jgi:hypothetical protein
MAGARTMFFFARFEGRERRKQTYSFEYRIYIYKYNDKALLLRRLCR